MHIELSIPMSELVFGDIIGRGNFAVVRKGTWNGTDVAIKTIEVPSHNTDYLTQEITVLM